MDKTNNRVEEIIEKLAAIEHERWGDWQNYCHHVLREQCPSPELEAVLERWDRQIATSYNELSEKEKQSDREQVKRYWHIIEKALASAYGQGVRDERERILEKLKYDLFPVQAKMENPGYWDGYTDTIFKIKDIIQALKNNNH